MSGSSLVLTNYCLPMDLPDLQAEARIARRYSEALIDDLSEDQALWRPNENSSAIGWHLGHQAAVNHFMVRNLTAAVPSINKDFDALFDSATVEQQRGELPPVGEILQFRAEVAEQTMATVQRIADGDVGAPEQLTQIAIGMVRAMINHEYQHAKWIGEVRHDLIGAEAPAPESTNLRNVEGYWMV